jgi:hypothetical protein
MTRLPFLSTVSSSIRRLTVPSLALLVMVVGVGFQLRGLYASGSIQSLREVTQRIRQPAWERGARTALGDSIGDYIRFVHDIVPEDGSIVLPPHNITSPFAEVGLMQLYFFPRKVYNCGRNEAEACMYRARTDHTYVLGIPHFPPLEFVLPYKAYVAFDSRWGLFVSPSRLP